MMGIVHNYFATLAFISRVGALDWTIEKIKQIVSKVEK